jgi:hypothetical protein
VDVPETKHKGEDDRNFTVPGHVYDIRVLSFKQFIAADPKAGRQKHLVQVWTDPGGMRTLSVGSLKLKDPKRVQAAKDRHERERAAD